MQEVCVWQYRKCMKVFLFLRWVWPLLLIFLPVWLCNFLLPDGADAVWNPVTIAQSWTDAVPELFGYSPAFCCGALFTMGVCLYWFIRWPCLLYAVLLFFAYAMAGPSWKTLVRMWNYMGTL